MKEARAGGLKLAIASTTSPENVESLLYVEFRQRRSALVQRHCHGGRRAEEEAGTRHLQPRPEATGRAPQRAIAFEDSAIGVRAAKAAGLFTVATPSLWTIGQDFSSADLRADIVGRSGRAAVCRPMSCGSARSTWGWTNWRPCIRRRWATAAKGGPV